MEDPQETFIQEAEQLAKKFGIGLKDAYEYLYAEVTGAPVPSHTAEVKVPQEQSPKRDPASTTSSGQLEVKTGTGSAPIVDPENSETKQQGQ